MSPSTVETTKMFLVAAATAGASFVLPDPVQLAGFLVATGIGLGTALGVGRAAYLKKAGPAQAEYLKIMEEARREGTEAKLEAATAALVEANGRRHEKEQEAAELRDEVDRLTTQLGGLVSDASDLAKLFLKNQGTIK